jgi:asparagine synthase (glutamine-hydrolysing)
VVDTWFRESLGGKMRGYLLDPHSLMFNCLKRKSVETLFNSHVEGKRDNHKILYSLVAFEEWLRCM